MTIEQLHQEGWIIFECIAGSKVYGLDTPTSDTDIRGVYILPKNDFYGLDYIDQISNESNDIVFYELRKFVDLLNRNNPNILEMLNVPEEFILQKKPLFDLLKPEIFLSKLCKDTFAGYAMNQIKKAYGLNKKILNPHDKERKSLLDFCFIIDSYGSKPLTQWLLNNNFNTNNCGLVNIPHMKYIYSLFYEADNKFNYQGIIKNSDSNEVSLSSIPKGIKPVGTIYVNIEGYSSYCKEYREYWEWVEKRNQERYKNTLTHGKNYDAKNMMHTFRLLDMAFEILSQAKIIVKRPNREELLDIKYGKYEYEELITKAHEKLKQIDEIYSKSILPDKPQRDKVEEILVKIRIDFYNQT
jgi:hypothetical protein